MMKNLYKATSFYMIHMTVHFTFSDFVERLAGQAIELCGVAGRAFSSHLPYKMR
jgi:hypothetical protein